MESNKLENGSFSCIEVVGAGWHETVWISMRQEQMTQVRPTGVGGMGGDGKWVEKTSE